MPNKRRSLEEVCEKGGYVASDDNVVVAKGEDRDLRKIKTKIDELLERIEREVTIRELYIGKTYCSKKILRRFDASDNRTWGMKGISNRYRDHKDEKEIHGLVVVAMVLKGTITGEMQRTCCPDENYTLDLEGDLISQYRKTHWELLNAKSQTSSHPRGRTSTRQRPAYVLYFAFTIDE